MQMFSKTFLFKFYNGKLTARKTVGLYVSLTFNDSGVRILICVDSASGQCGGT